MKPFWNQHSSRISSKIHSQTNEISFQDEVKSVKLSKIHKQKLKLNLKQNTIVDKSIVTKKIRIYPNENQVELFLKCFKAHRYIYNKALDYFNNTKDSNFFRLQKAAVVNDPLLEPLEKWLKDIPKDTRVQAVKLLSKNIKTAFANVKRGIVKHFKMRFLSKKHSSDIFSVNRNAFSFTEKQSKKELRIFYYRLKNYSKLKISNKSRRWLENTEGVFNSKFKLLHFASITMKKDGSWYLLVSYDKTPKETKSMVIDDLVALDPGVRTFQTFYSENSYGKLGEDFVTKRLKSLNSKADKLISASTKAKGKKKYNLRMRCNKIRSKVSNTVLDLHRKAANFLTNHYNVILIPSFETQKMVVKKFRNISKATSRNMNQLSHYAFRQRLIDLSKREKRCEVIVCAEEFTSKTCGKCGKINRTLGSSKVFKCPDNRCNFTLDRDVNGARNILIKYITELCNDDTPTKVVFRD